MSRSSDDMDGPVEDIGSRSCVTRFVKTLLSIMEHGVKPHSKHLTEYFAFLFEFAKMGEEEVREDTLCFKSEEHTQTRTRLGNDNLKMYKLFWQLKENNHRT